MKIFKLFTVLWFVFLYSCEKSIPDFNAQNSFGYLLKQTDFGPRNPGSTGHDECRQWLVSELKKYAVSVFEQRFTHEDMRLDTTIQMTNIIASFNPEFKKRILLCAHWDTRPHADKDEPHNINTPILGANDGASGVAVLLEIARNLNNEKPEVGVDIFLFDGEDYGLEGDLEEYFLGSKYFAANMLNTYKPVFGILVDMVGDAQLSLPVEYYSHKHAPQVVEKVWSAAEKLGYSQFERKSGPAVSDDHLPLIQAGIKCIDIIDFQYPDDTHKYWHTLQDTPDKCSPRSLKAVGQTLLQVIYTE
jgi:hypothetical protein